MHLGIDGELFFYIKHKEAKELGIPFYFDGAVCKNGVMNKRRTSNRMCLCSLCANQRKEYAKNRRSENPEIIKEIEKRTYLKYKDRGKLTSRIKWEGKNKERILREKREKYHENPKMYQERNRAWKAKNPEYGKNIPQERKEGYRAKDKLWRERNKEKRRIYSKEYQKKNKHRHAAQEAMRRAIKAKATPKWLTQSQLDEIGDIYRLASDMSRGNVKFQVDHVVPLRGKDVCGLHVPWNMQIITATENAAKNNFTHMFQDWIIEEEFVLGNYLRPDSRHRHGGVETGGGTSGTPV